MIFHGITAVAELKDRYEILLNRVKPNFPRHHRRGRIEGTHAFAEYRNRPLIFHGITAVAELKEHNP